MRFGLEVVGSAGAHRAPQHQEGALGRGCRGSRCADGLGREPVVSVLLDRQSGLADLLPSLRPEVVYVGTSGGAMVATPDFGGQTYDDSEPLTGSGEALGLVDFSVFPHLEREDMPDTSLANIESWAAGLSVPAYAIDDQTAIRVVGGNVEVVSEGHWKLFTPSPEAS